MKLHEYQSRDIFLRYQIPVSKSKVVFVTSEAARAYEECANVRGAVAKVQVLMGGRGKAGGVKLIKNSSEATQFCEKFLGKPFSTYQSGGESKTVKAVLVAEDADIQKEYYLAITLDRSAKSPVILFCAQGGVDIEEIAQRNPEAILKIGFKVTQLPSPKDLEPHFRSHGLESSQASQAAQIASRLSSLFVEEDASIAEINPLIVTSEGMVQAIDAKVVMDDNAAFRHPHWQELQDPEEYDARERRAQESGLNYVSMCGNVGCLVNGAGLAMATMDMIKLAGGEPANFLDVGGGANADQVAEAFKIILDDPKVKSILVNIFGGIMKCDVIAEGIISASKQVNLKVPLVVRLEGTRVEIGREMLKKSGLAIESCESIDKAALLAVERARGK